MGSGGGLEDLRALAEAATPGPWTAVEGDLEGKPVSEYARTLFANRENDGTTTARLFLTTAPNNIDPELGATVVPALTGDGPRSEANAAFIAAANPTAVLALLDRLAAAEGAVEHWKRTCVTWSEEYALIWKVGREVSAVLAGGPDTWTPYESRDAGLTFLADSVLEFTADLRAAIDGAK